MNSEYQRLQDNDRCCWRLFGRMKENDTMTIDKLVRSLDMKIQGERYYMTELKLKAKKAAQTGDKVLAIAYLQECLEKEERYKHLVGLFSRARQMASSIEDAHMFAQTANVFERANKTHATKQLELDKVKEIMDEWEELNAATHEIGAELSRTSLPNVDAEYAKLLEVEEIELPSVPVHNFVKNIPNQIKISE